MIPKAKMLFEEIPFLEGRAALIRVMVDPMVKFTRIEPSIRGK
jgi:hypothetical protein